MNVFMQGVVKAFRVGGQAMDAIGRRIEVNANIDSCKYEN